MKLNTFNFLIPLNKVPFVPYKERMKMKYKIFGKNKKRIEDLMKMIHNYQNKYYELENAKNLLEKKLRVHKEWRSSKRCMNCNKEKTRYVTIGDLPNKSTEYWCLPCYITNHNDL